eukprot:COSAG06_NODE_1572_length_9064_cov_8.042052_6_plen_208_part_00
MQQAVRAQGRYLQKQELEPQLSRNHLKLARASGSGRDCLVLRETISIDRHLAHETLQQASNNPASKQATTQQATCMYTRRTQKNRESRRSCENPPRKPPPLPKKQARRRARNTRFFCLIYPPCWSFGCGCGCGLLSNSPLPPRRPGRSPPPGSPSASSPAARSAPTRGSQAARAPVRSSARSLDLLSAGPSLSWQHLSPFILGKPFS